MDENTNRKFLTIIPYLVALLGATFVMTYVLHRVVHPTKFVDVLTAALVTAMGVMSSIFSLYFFRKTMHKEPLGVVFLSHSMKDEAVAKKIIKVLDKAQIKVLTSDTELRVGDRIEEKLKTAIENSAGVVLIISTNSRNSSWVKREIDLAKKSEKRLFPALVGDVEAPSDLAEIVYVKLDPDRPAGAQRLAASVREFLQLSKERQSVVGWRS